MEFCGIIKDYRIGSRDAPEFNLSGKWIGIGTSGHYLIKYIDKEDSIYKIKNDSIVNILKKSDNTIVRLNLLIYRR